MNWSNVRLILERELRDQLRDRRSLFVIFVLPILLYPFLGMSLFQVAQFVQQHASRVLVVGADDLRVTPALFENEKFAARWLGDAVDANLIELHFAGEIVAAEKVEETARRAVDEEEYEAVVFFPADFGRGLEQVRRNLPPSDRAAAAEHTGGAPARRTVEVPSPRIYWDDASEKSQLANARLRVIMERWREEVGRENLETAGLSRSAAKPFDVALEDVADERHRDAALWAKIFPFLLLIWALTGAFYPAVDLCAGEKERGTLETLLISPAERTEIVWGKLLTIMTFSSVTVVLNLVSMGVTGLFVISQLEQFERQFGPPPLSSFVWLLVALVPVSALFSALCLALAALARSTKEGQYYLMPLVLVAMPLVVLPMAPGVELTLGNSLIPVTGLVLLLRAAVEGDYAQALPFIPPVVAVTLACCLLAIRWAVEQFNSEGVLFRESERLDLALWVRHLMRDRGETPSVAEAVACGVVILLVRFFMSFALRQPESFRDFAVLAIVTQLVVVFTPALLMTVMFTRSPAKTLLLRLPRPSALLAAVLLAVCLHPLANLMQRAMTRLYPISDDVTRQLGGLLEGAESLAMLLFVVAVVPAIVEELAFRGFILSGFRHMGHKWRAIVLASIFFGMSHAVFQQSLVAFVVGIVIGYVTVQSGSIVPAMAMHMVHNSLAVLPSRVTRAMEERYPFLERLFADSTEAGYTYPWPVMALSVIGVAVLLTWFHWQPAAKSPEETLQEAIDHEAASPLAG